MKRVLLFTLIFSILGIIFSDDIYSQAYQGWKFTHPTPQANNLRNLQMINENTWFAVGANGTFMRTTDAGAHWFFHHQAGRYTNNAKSIGGTSNLWFFDANNGYVTGEAGYIGKTTNGGTTFDSVGVGVIPSNESGVGIWFANQDTGFVTTRQPSWLNGRIVRTTNGGTTWTTVQTYAQGITAIWGTNSQTVYAVAVDGTIFKTTNGGTTWTPSTFAVGQYLYGMSFLNENTGFAAGSEGQIYRTTNSGLIWTQLNSPQVDWAYFQIKVVSATEIYAVGDPAFLYKTTDLGNTWQTINIMPVNGPASTFVWYSMGKVGNTMTLGGDFGVVAKSTNNGSTWSANHFSLNTNILFDLEKVPGSNNLLAVGRQYDIGTRQIFFSSDWGTNWISRDLGVDMNASSICMVNSQVGYISGTNAQVLKTTDGGANWFQVTQPFVGTNDIYTIDFVTPDIGWAFVNYAPPSGGSVYKTTDGGTSWVPQTNGLPANSVYSADMVDANIGYLCINSSNQPIYKTTNGGTNWTSITTPLTGIIKTIQALDANKLFVGAGSGTVRLVKSTDGGANWIPLTLPATIDVSSLDFMDADTGYVCGNTTTAVCRTTNGGSTWTFENVHLPTLSAVAVLPNDVVFAMGTYGSILRYDPHGFVPVELLAFTSSVSGNNVILNWSTATEVNNRGFEIERALIAESPGWQRIGFVPGNGTTSEVRSFSYTDQGLNPGGYLYRLKQIDYDGTLKYYDQIQVEISVPFNFTLRQNYPNPFNPNTTISYSVPQNSLVNIKVFNIIGQEVSTLVNEVKPAGNYQMNFDGNGLASGTYLVKMQAGNFNSIIKMTLLK